MEVSFSPRDTAYSDTYVTLIKCLYSTIETMIMSLATKNNVSTGYFSCSGRISKGGTLSKIPQSKCQTKEQ
jgi:hypothetical protein